MQLSLNVKYAKLPDDVKTPDVLTRFLITEAITRRFPQGLPRTESRLYATALDRFYEETAEIDIDESVFLFIKESVDQAVLPAHCSSWKWSLIAHLEAVAREKEKRET